MKGCVYYRQNPSYITEEKVERMAPDMGNCLARKASVYIR